MFFFFFFKQKTAYDMRISDWSSDVCSSDLQSHYSRHWMTHEVNQSLRRLNTEHLDILYLHRDFHEENLDEAVRTLGDLISAGKIRAFGLSNFRGWRIAEIIRLCEKTNVPQPVVRSEEHTSELQLLMRISYA